MFVQVKVNHGSFAKAVLSPSRSRCSLPWSPWGQPCSSVPPRRTTLPALRCVAVPGGWLQWQLEQGASEWSTFRHMGMGQNLVALVNIKIAGKWMFIPLKMVLIGIDPYPYVDRIMWAPWQTMNTRIPLLSMREWQRDFGETAMGPNCSQPKNVASTWTSPKFSFIYKYQNAF